MEKIPFVDARSTKDFLAELEFNKEAINFWIAKAKEQQIKELSFVISKIGEKSFKELMNRMQINAIDGGFITEFTKTDGIKPVSEIIVKIPLSSNSMPIN